MPKMGDLDQFSVFVQPVIDLDRRVDKFADIRAPWHRDAESRKALKHGNVVENCAAKTRGRLGKVDPGVFEDLRKIR